MNKIALSSSTILYSPMQISINLIMNEPRSFEIFIFPVYFHRIDYLNLFHECKHFM